MDDKKDLKWIGIDPSGIQPDTTVITDFIKEYEGVFKITDLHRTPEEQKIIDSYKEINYKHNHFENIKMNMNKEIKNHINKYLPKSRVAHGFTIYAPSLDMFIKLERGPGGKTLLISWREKVVECWKSLELIGELFGYEKAQFIDQQGSLWNERRGPDVIMYFSREEVMDWIIIPVKYEMWAVKFVNDKDKEFIYTPDFTETFTIGQIVAEWKEQC